MLMGFLACELVLLGPSFEGLLLWFAKQQSKYLNLRAFTCFERSGQSPVSPYDNRASDGPIRDFDALRASVSYASPEALRTLSL